MKKVFALIAVLALIAPVFADDVTVTVAENATEDGIVITVDNLPTGIALTVSSDAANIVSGGNVDSFFDIFIDEAYTSGDPCTANTNPLADPAGPGVDPTADGDTVVCVAHLEGTTDGTSQIVEILTDVAAGSTTNVTVDVDTLRGGAVNDNGVMNVIGLPITVEVGSAVVECLKNTDPGYAYWAANGMPDCWCYQKQCNGDADGVNAGPFAVSFNDLNLVKAAFNKTVLQPGQICADFDHVAAGPFRVSFTDLNKVKQYFNKTVVPVCPMDHINFWTN